MKTNKILFSRLTGPTKNIISLKKPSKSLLITSTNNNNQISNKTQYFDSQNLEELSKENSFYKTRNHTRQFSMDLNLNLNIKLNPFHTQTNIKSSLSQKKYFSPSHSIFTRFQKEFKKCFNKSINNTKDKFSRTIFKYKPNLFPTIVEREKKRKLKVIELRKKNPFQIIKTYRGIFDPSDDEDDNHSYNEKNIKSITFSEPSNINFTKKDNYKRKRTFKNYIKEQNILDKNWKINLGLRGIEYKFNSYLENDIKFQSNIIKDELCIILDNIQYYKSVCLSSENIIASYKNKDLFFQIKTNKILEETNALLNYIPKIILKDYYDYTEKFIAVEQPSFDDFKVKIIKNEPECFIINAKLLSKTGKFLKSCFDVYIDLISQIEENMVIKKKDFDLLLAIFEKVRFLIGELTISGKNAIKDLEFDRQLINKYKPLIMSDSKENKNHFENNSKEKNYIYSENNSKEKNIKKTHKKNKSENIYNTNNNDYNINKVDIGEKMTKDLKFQRNEESLKIQRIKNSLNTYKKDKFTNEDLKEKQALMLIKGKPGPMKLINSDLMTKMLKYLKKDVRGKIISLRTVERFHLNSEK